MAGEYGAHGPGIKEVLAAANLVVALVIVFVAARKGFAEAVKQRAQKISQDIVQAKNELIRVRAEADRARRELQELDQTRKRFVEEVKGEGEKAYALTVHEARKTADKILEDARLAADNEMNAAIAQLQAAILDKTIEQTQALLSVESGCDPALQKRVHDKLFERLSSSLTRSPEGRA